MHRRDAVILSWIGHVGGGLARRLRPCARAALIASWSLSAGIATLFFLSAPVRAATPSAPTLIVLNAWSRPTPPGAAVGVAYFEIVNSALADTLTQIETPVAGHVEMHSTSMVNDVMQMRPMPSVEIPASARVEFKPGGLHAMLIELKEPLKPGQRFPLTLVFAHAGRIYVEAIVQDL
jgi:copper(I)-binding protein